MAVKKPKKVAKKAAKKVVKPKAKKVSSPKVKVKLKPKVKVVKVKAAQPKPKRPAPQAQRTATSVDIPIIVSTGIPPTIPKEAPVPVPAGTTFSLPRADLDVTYVWHDGDYLMIRARDAKCETAEYKLSFFEDQVVQAMLDSCRAAIAHRHLA